MSWDANGSPVCEPYDVECSRCGVTLSCEDAYIEEGDEWECEPCNIRCDADEYYDTYGIDINFNHFDVLAELDRRAVERYLSKG